MINQQACAICGRAGYDRDVAWGLVQWKDGSFGYGTRCRDVWQCYQNVNAIGDEWPLKRVPKAPKMEGDIPW